MDSEMADRVRKRLLENEGVNWCDEAIFPDEPGPGYWCRETKGHKGDHDCPAKRKAEGR